MKSVTVFDFTVVTKNIPARYKAGKLNEGDQKNPKIMPRRNTNALSGGMSWRNLMDLG